MNNTFQVIYEWKNKVSKEAGKAAAKIFAQAKQATLKNNAALKSGKMGFAGAFANDVKNSLCAGKAAHYIQKGQEAVGKGRKTLAGKVKHFAGLTDQTTQYIRNTGFTNRTGLKPSLKKII